MAYNGERNENGIIQFINKKTGPPSEAQETPEGLEKAKQGPLNVVYFGKEDDQYKVFQEFASVFTVESANFYHVFETSPVYETEACKLF